uniref:hypothetical protein n=1 Tax=Carnobacterium TaxID=2747 RepID=UPI0034502D34
MFKSQPAFITGLSVFLGVLIFELTLGPIISNFILRYAILFIFIYISSMLGSILMKKIDKWDKKRMDNKNMKL